MQLDDVVFEFNLSVSLINRLIKLHHAEASVCVCVFFHEQLPLNLIISIDLYQTYLTFIYVL